MFRSVYRIQQFAQDIMNLKKESLFRAMCNRNFRYLHSKMWYARDLLSMMEVLWRFHVCAAI